MIQLAAVILIFSFLPLLNKLKVNLSYSLLICCGLLALVSVKDINILIHLAINVFTNFSSLNTILSVMMVGTLGGLMKHYKILDKIVDSIFNIIKNKKLILMILPALIGILIIPGGALLSAPFINKIGGEMKIPPPRRAAINLIFRHIAMFLVPYSSGLLIINATLPQLNIFKVIMLNLFYIIPIIFLGYLLFIKNIKYEAATEMQTNGKIFNLFLYTSPIYICVIINIFTGLPFFITLIASIVIVYLLCDKIDFIKILFKSLNFHTILMIIAILFIKEIIMNMEEIFILLSDFYNVENSMLSILLIFLVSSVFFGIVTGNQMAVLAIILPMVTQLNVSINMIYVYTYFCFAGSFIGYFFSPIHLCQAFTLQNMNVTTTELYKEYKLFLPISLTVLFSSVYLMTFILN